jgi:DNA-binding response OmpR family regulator
MHHLMVIDGDEPARARTAAQLLAYGHEVRSVGSGDAALREAGRMELDLVLLDAGAEGPELCGRLRALQPSCVLVLVGSRHGGEDVVAGLKAGADDYLVAPVPAPELVARVQAHLRRGPGRPRTPVQSVGSLRIDLTAHRCLLGDHEVRLRPKEFDLLARLAAEPGRAVRRETLMTDVWQENWFGSTRTLDVHVGWIRRRLRDTAARAAVTPVRITTVRGHGFRLEA